jgi:NADH dehydrogenase FAD-containing subunit
MELGYDVLVLAAGSVTRAEPVPGLAENGIGFSTLGEAIHLRNHVLSRLDVASSTDDYTVDRLAKRGMEIRLGTRVRSMIGGHVVLSDGTELDADTVIWTAGVRANPVAARSGLPVDDHGRLRCSETLRVPGFDGIWSRRSRSVQEGRSTC